MKTEIQVYLNISLTEGLIWYKMTDKSTEYRIKLLDKTAFIVSVWHTFA